MLFSCREKKSYNIAQTQMNTLHNSIVFVKNSGFNFDDI